MSLCFWWKLRSLADIKPATSSIKKLCNPLSAGTWKTLEELNRLKPFRGNRGRRKADNFSSTTSQHSQRCQSTFSETDNEREPRIDFNIINMQSHKIPNRFNAIPTLVTDGRSHYKLNTYRRSCHANLIHIRTCNPRPYDFPKIFLSNTRSMVNKLDEICAVVTSNGSDIAVITESWL